MRKPEYLSPSALGVYDTDPSEYYLRYLGDVRPPRAPQTQPMSVGSAFDAYIKSHLHKEIYGVGHPEASKYELERLLKEQVEAPNLDWARLHGEYLFQQYRASGALADLMIELNKAVDEPRFEFEVRGRIGGTRGGVPLLGKPDIRFVNSEGAEVIFDWKVNGYCSKWNVSPMPGYVECRKQVGSGWTRTGAHRDAFCAMTRGIMLNVGAYLEQYNQDWATQLATYSWLLGAAIGSEEIVGIDQVACNGAKRDLRGYPEIRFASHRLRVSSRYQQTVLARYQNLWDLITEEPFHYFRDLSLARSQEACSVLDAQATMLSSPDIGSDERWALLISR